MTNISQIKRAEIDKLPVREWNSKSIYDSILALPTRRKHDSGWNLFMIVGCRSQEPIEICGYLDDLSFKFPESHNPKGMFLRTDFSHSLKCPHFWSNYYTFEVGTSLSSTSITLIPRNQLDTHPQPCNTNPTARN